MDNSPTTHIVINRLISQNEIVLVAAGYTAIFLMLMLVISTYLLAWKSSQPRSHSLLALALFFIASEIMIAYNAIISWVYLSDTTLSLPRWTQLRVITLFFATCYVLYTAWSRNTNIKIVEIKPKHEENKRITDL